MLSNNRGDLRVRNLWGAFHFRRTSSRFHEKSQKQVEKKKRKGGGCSQVIINAGWNLNTDMLLSSYNKIKTGYERISLIKPSTNGLTLIK